MTGRIASGSLTAEYVNSLDSMAKELIQKHATGLDIAPLRISRRMWKTLGRYTPSRREITLSEWFLTKSDDAAVREVLKHEVAHAVTGHCHPGARSHGKEFREVCRKIGADPSAAVDMGAGYGPPISYFGFSCPYCGSEIWRKQRARFLRCRCGNSVRPRQFLRIRRRPPDPGDPEGRFYTGDLEVPAADPAGRGRTPEKWRFQIKCPTCGVVNRRKRKRSIIRCRCGVRLRVLAFGEDSPGLG